MSPLSADEVEKWTFKRNKANDAALMLDSRMF